MPSLYKKCREGSGTKVTWKRVGRTLLSDKRCTCGSDIPVRQISGYVFLFVWMDLALITTRPQGLNLILSRTGMSEAHDHCQTLPRRGMSRATRALQVGTRMSDPHTPGCFNRSTHTKRTSHYRRSVILLLRHGTIPKHPPYAVQHPTAMASGVTVNS